MWTFTVDPQLFNSPKDAYWYVKEQRAVSRTINRLKDLGHLHSGRWFCVVEWQKNGMPHWHVLLDATRIPFSVMCDIWNSFRPGWAGPVEGTRPGFGSIRFSATDHNFVGAEHAAHYACKYMIKHPDHGYPDWVLDSTRRIRRYETSRCLLTPPAEPTEDIATDEPPEIEWCTEFEHPEGCVCIECTAKQDESEAVPKSTIRQRLAKCKQEAVIIHVAVVTRDDGQLEEVRRFVRNVETPFWKIAKALNQKIEKSLPLYVTNEELDQLDWIIAKFEHEEDLKAGI
ncbi:rolling circle replication-associated protein [Bremerella sp. P1]|uniref:rolling circle replication-associated protein n=1 Tax=Bremerella sp. P1 TaxID=3026424 RepID=UPI002367E23F|nr:hypothetical protein [Bremerella sp. P1]WDI43969.1 hypothetical protein PSR63_08475 [Bremerella sp. P1]